jgi:hypothetical protein
MGYQPRNELRELEEKVDFWHMMISIATSVITVALCFVPSIILPDPYAPIWFVISTSMTIPFWVWCLYGKSHEIAIWWVMRPENKRLAEENAKVLRNRIIRESEEFITECRGKNEIQS